MARYDLCWDFHSVLTENLKPVKAWIKECRSSWKTYARKKSFNNIVQTVQSSPLTSFCLILGKRPKKIHTIPRWFHESHFSSYWIQPRCGFFWIRRETKGAVLINWSSWHLWFAPLLCVTDGDVIDLRDYHRLPVLKANAQKSSSCFHFYVYTGHSNRNGCFHRRGHL